jgi:2-oxoglutarate ferredoxin oxidoreductase subunit gamma
MKELIFFAGSGGQGVLSAGKMFSEAVMEEGKQITYFPSYGSAVRGGTSNVTVCVSDSPIACPVVIPGKVSVGVYFNLESMDAFEDYVVPGGMLLYNESLVSRAPTRTDIRYFSVPANRIAESIGGIKSVNMVMLGALLALTGICNCETMYGILDELFVGSKKKFAEINRNALKAGMEYMRAHAPAKEEVRS